MSEKMIVITEFLSASKPINHQGHIFSMHERKSAALIFPISGALEFSWGDESVIADCAHPVFIPRGMRYTNRCIATAQSLMFNLQALCDESAIRRLLLPNMKNVHRIYDEITVLQANLTARKQSKIFEKLYQLLGECLPVEAGDQSSLLTPALALIEKSYHEKDLKLETLAASCSISVPYLHKLFLKEFSMTPFQYITRTRMKQAQILLREMQPVGAVAAMVGYGDIYQFSRAFKRFYHCSPKAMQNDK